MHSTTKYLSGHSDVLGGALIFGKDDAFAQRVRQLQSLSGAVPSPFDCWLVSRGIKTLGVRVRAQMATAQAVAEFLDGHPAVEAVHFPGLLNHPDRALIQQQMNGPGAMLSVQISARDGGSSAREALQFIGKLQLITRATSLGGVESLIETPGQRRRTSQQDTPEFATPFSRAGTRRGSDCGFGAGTFLNCSKTRCSIFPVDAFASR